MQQKRYTARIWCAACASGEEPYTIAMLAREYLPPEFQLELYASDISTSMLEMAAVGIYSLEAVKPIPQGLLHKYFQEGHHSKAGLVRIKPALRGSVRFSQLNLIIPPYQVQHPLDVIFCRNVMIYFDQATRNRVVMELGRLLRAGGLLFLGLSESLPAEQRQVWQAVATSAYRRKPAHQE